MKQKKAKVLAQKGKAVRQVGALVYRRLPEQELEILLLTSRGTSRFVIPMKGKLNSRAAVLEAEQEAGITGQVSADPIGSYRYWKRLRTLFVPVTVVVYAIEAEAELSHWQERRQRKRRWLRVDAAASLVDEPELVSLITSFGHSKCNVSGAELGSALLASRQSRASAFG